MNHPAPLVPHGDTLSRRMGLVNVLIDESLQGTEVARSTTFLNASGDWSRQPDKRTTPRSRTGTVVPPSHRTRAPQEMTSGYQVRTSSFRPFHSGKGHRSAAAS